MDTALAVGAAAVLLLSLALFMGLLYPCVIPPYDTVIYAAVGAGAAAALFQACRK